jgi:DNA-binding response OmpR family regulator
MTAGTRPSTTGSLRGRTTDTGQIIALMNRSHKMLLALASSPERKRCANVASILILDEQVDSCMLIKRVLEREGHNVITSADREDGVRLAADLALDLVILNTKAHCKNVAKFVSDMRRINPRLKMMTITNYVSDVVEQAVWDDFMLKPVDIDVLEIKVRALLKTQPLNESSTTSSD